MRFPFALTLLAAGAGVIIVLMVGVLLLRPPLPLILEAGFDREVISPNADGEDDIAVFSYALARPAQVSFSLTNEAGLTFFFRREQPRADDEYSVLFSGVVDGFLHEGETVPGVVERRLIPNGAYSWLLEAKEHDGEALRATGSLSVEAGDTPLPIMSEFRISPDVFSPNQDGVADRVSINVYLEKGCRAAGCIFSQDRGERASRFRRGWKSGSMARRGGIVSIMRAGLIWASIRRQMGLIR